MKLLTKKVNADYTTGPLFLPYLGIAIPLLISNLVHRLYNVADQAVVGRFSGNVNALGAIGATSVLNNALINTLTGLSVGVSIALSRSIGNKDKARTSSLLHTSILFALLIGILFGAVGFFLSRPVLTALGTKPEHIELAVSYIKVIFLGLPVHTVLSFTGVALCAKGKSSIQASISIASGIINVALNVVFVALFHMSVVGVALATVISELLALFAELAVLSRDEPELAFSIRRLKISSSPLWEILQIGIPNALQMIVYSVGSVFISTTKNTLPLDLLNAAAAAGSTSGLLTPIASGFGITAVSVLVAQNYGAKNIKRINKVIRISALTVAAIYAVIIPLFAIFSKGILSLFLDPEIENYSTLLAYATPLLLLQPIEIALHGLTNIFSSSERAIGHSTVPLIVALAVNCGFSILWCTVIFPLFSNPILFFLLGTCIQVLCLTLTVIPFVIHMRALKRDFTRLPPKECTVNA